MISTHRIGERVGPCILIAKRGNPKRAGAASVNSVAVTSAQSLNSASGASRKAGGE